MTRSDAVDEFPIRSLALILNGFSRAGFANDATPHGAVVCGVLRDFVCALQCVVGCLQCVFVCCSVHCSVWTHDCAFCCGVSKYGVSVLQRAAVLIVCGSVLKCVAVCYSVLQFAVVFQYVDPSFAALCVSVCGPILLWSFWRLCLVLVSCVCVLQCRARVCCSVLQCVALTFAVCGDIMVHSFVVFLGTLFCASVV